MDAIEQMQTFVRIVETGSLSAAARGRELSLAAVSRQLSALEAELGATLVLRSTRRLAITDSGRRWYQHCKRLLDELADARADVADTRAPRGTVVISAPITYGFMYAAPRLEQLGRAHPDLVLDLRLEDHVVDLVGDAVDIAIRAGIAPPDSASIIAHPIDRFRRIAVAAPAYLKRAGVPKHPRDLERHDTLVQHGVAAVFTQSRFERAGEIVDVRLRSHMRSSSPIVLHAWALAGAGIALLPEWLVDRPRDGKLQRVLDGWLTPEIHAWALHRIEMRDAPRIRAVIDALARP